jgi:hypothetical protein
MLFYEVTCSADGRVDCLRVRAAKYDYRGLEIT